MSSKGKDSEKYVTENILEHLRKNLKSNVKPQDILDNYINFLEEHYPSLATQYQQRLESNRTGARAEAIAFYFFSTSLDEIEINEHSKKGGTDFLCKTEHSNFVAEITSIATDTITKKSGLKDNLTEGVTVWAFSPITQKLCDTVNSKEAQMSEYDLPGVLVIASDHLLADLLFTPFHTERLLVGDITIGLSIPKIRQENQEVSFVNQTDLKYGCFLQKNQDWHVCNRSISAVILFHMTGAYASMLGLLHPDPKHDFLPNFLPSVPFVKLKKYPPDQNVLEVEWVKYEGNELVVVDDPEKIFWYDTSFNSH